MKEDRGREAPGKCVEIGWLRQRGGRILKRIAAIGLLLCCCALSGCAPQGAFQSQESAQGGEAPAITLLSFPDQDRDYLEAAIRRADLGFEVEIIEVPQNQYESKAQMMLMGQQATDLILVDAPNLAGYASSGTLEPLDAYWGKSDFGDLTPSMQQSMQWKGKTWAAPLNDSTCLLFYNKALFREVGIEPAAPGEGWDMETLMENAVRLTKRDVYGNVLQYGIQPVMFTPDNKNEGMAYTQMLYLWWFGADLIDPLTGEAGLRSPQAQEALRYYYDLYVTHKVAPLYEIANGFTDGKIAMWINGPWVLGVWKDNFPEFYENGWGVMPLPHGQFSASPCGSWNVAMTKQSKHKQQAWQVIQALTGQEGMKLWCEGTGNIPARTSVMEDITYGSMQAAYTLAIEQLNSTSRARPVMPAYPAISEALVSCFNSIAYGTRPEAILGETERKINQALQMDRGGQE